MKYTVTKDYILHDSTYISRTGHSIRTKIDLQKWIPMGWGDCRMTDKGCSFYLE